jgi:hypothetical protein
VVVSCGEKCARIQLTSTHQLISRNQRRTNQTLIADKSEKEPVFPPMLTDLHLKINFW